MDNCPFCESDQVEDLPEDSEYRKLPLVDAARWRKCSECGAEFRLLHSTHHELLSK